MEIVRSGFPMERVAVDILGELPITERGNRYILVIGHYFTNGQNVMLCRIWRQAQLP